MPTPASKPTLFYNPSPLFKQNQRGRDRVWTTQDGHFYNSKIYRFALIQNSFKVLYKSAFTLWFPASKSISQLKKERERLFLTLKRKGIVAHCQLEISKGNRLHFHGISLNEKSQLKEVWKSIKNNFTGWTLKIIQKVKNWKSYCAYIVKAKVETENSKDLYASKRIYPVKKLGLNKHYTINSQKFWAKKPEEYWQKVKDRKAEIAEYKTSLSGYGLLLDYYQDITGFTREYLEWRIDPEAKVNAELRVKLLNEKYHAAEYIEHGTEQIRPAQRTRMDQGDGLVRRGENARIQIGNRDTQPDSRSLPEDTPAVRSLVRSGLPFFRLSGSQFQRSNRKRDGVVFFRFDDCTGRGLRSGSKSSDCSERLTGGRHEREAARANPPFEFSDTS
jgi:hypothetical protein